MERLLAGWTEECVERGYLLILVWLRQMSAGDWAEGLATTIAGADIGEQYGDLDLTWLARDDQSRALVKLGRLDAELGDSSVNHCFEVAAEPAFAERPLGLATKPLALRSA